MPDSTSLLFRKLTAEPQIIRKISLLFIPRPQMQFFTFYKKQLMENCSFLILHSHSKNPCRRMDFGQTAVHISLELQERVKESTASRNKN